MRLSYVFTVLLFNFTAAKILYQNHSNHATAECVTGIIKRYFEHKITTFVNFGARDINVLPHLHEINSVINKGSFTKMRTYNSGYLIYTRNIEDFTAKFQRLLTEPTWMPFSLFVIVVKSLELDKLGAIFEELLRVHIKNAIVIDFITTQTYTYNPFDNNGCGKHFDRVIRLGKCLAEMPTDFFPIKINLQNCVMKVAATHWPPYTINPSKSEVNATGIDENLLSLITEVEHVKFKITYVDDLADQVSTINEDMVASGPLGWLQKNKYDIVMGAYVLTVDRGIAFTTLHAHTAYDDEFRVIVRRAGTVPQWTMIYREFTPSVWLLLVFTVITVATLFIVTKITPDKTLIFLNMFDNMLQHGCKIKRSRKNEVILSFWIIFACLIAVYYVTSLVGLTTKPVYKYQVESFEDIQKHNFRPCISDAVWDFMKSVSALDGLDLNTNNSDLNCKKMNESLKTVSQSQDMFTIVPYSLYYSNIYRYKNGINELYSRRVPVSKIIYAIFMYKGFPLYEKLNKITLQMRASGLGLKAWKDYEYKQFLRYKMLRQEDKPIFILPMFILYFGWVISFLCFILEIMNSKRKLTQINVVC